MLEFGKYNANPKSKKTGDCVVRAISVATNQEYEKVMRDLFELGLSKGFIFNDQRTYEKYLESLGWIKHKQPRHANNKWYEVHEVEELINDFQTAIVSMHGHLSVVVAGTLVDTGDCRHSALSNYWTHPSEGPGNTVCKQDITFEPITKRRVL